MNPAEYKRFTMNTVDFTEKYYIDRRGSHSRKWNGEHLKFSRTDLLPLWVADMDFMPLSAFRMPFVAM